MVFVVVLVEMGGGLRWCFLDFSDDGGLVVVVMMVTTALRMAVFIRKNYLFLFFIV